jgi:hypothetical protein
MSHAVFELLHSQYLTIVSSLSFIGRCGVRGLIRTCIAETLSLALIPWSTSNKSAEVNGILRERSDAHAKRQREPLNG